MSIARPLNACFSHALRSHDSTDSHTPDLPGRSTYTRGVGKSITRPADPLTAVTPQIKVHAATGRAVLNNSGPPVTRYTWAQNHRTNKRWRKLLYLQIRPKSPRDTTKTANIRKALLLVSTLTTRRCAAK